MGHGNLNLFSKNKSLHLQGAYYVLGTILSVSCILLILVAALQGRYYYYPHVNKWRRKMPEMLSNYKYSQCKLPVMF